MDGDGSFTKMDGTSIAFTLASTFDQDWIEHEKVMQSIGVEYTIRRKIVKHGRVSILYATNIDNVVKWGTYLYQGFDQDKIGLPRKHARWRVAVAKQAERDAHDSLVVKSDEPFDADSVFRLIARYNGLLSRRKMCEAFGVKSHQMDKIIRQLRDDKRIVGKGKLSSRRFFIKV